MAANIEPEKSHVSLELKHGKPLLACRFDATGHCVYASSEDETIACWDLNGPKASQAAPKVMYTGHDGWCFAMAFSPDGRTMLSGGTDGMLIWWAAGGQVNAPAAKDHAQTQQKPKGKPAPEPPKQPALTPRPLRVIRA